MGIGWGQKVGYLDHATSRCGIIEVSIESSVVVLPSHLLGFFFLEIQMKQLTTYINAVRNHLASDIDLGEAYAKAQPIIARMKAEERTVWFHTNIAPLVAQSYAVELVMTRNGTTSFNDKKSGKRHDTALSKFRYVTQIKLESNPKVSTQIDVVEKALTLVESMTKAQQEKFFKRVSKK